MTRQNLARQPVILTPQLAAVSKTITDSFYQELDSEFDGFAGHVLISSHAFDKPWGVWEMHPAGDEVVVLLSGDIDFILRTDDGDRTLRVTEPGDYIVVPKGLWHTARPRAPTTMLFITPGEGTENRDEPG